MDFRHGYALVAALGLFSCGDVAEERGSISPQENTMVPAMGSPNEALVGGERLDAGGLSESGLRRERARFCVPIARSDGSLQSTSDPKDTLKRPGMVVVTCSEKERTTPLHLEVVLGEEDSCVLQKDHTLRLRLHPMGAGVEGQLGIHTEEAESLQVLDDDEKEPSPILDSNCLECTFDGGTRLPIRLELRSNCLPAYALDASAPLALPEAQCALLTQGHAGSLATRAPREVWLELEHRDAQGGLLDRDVALCTLAPFTFRCELDPPEQLHAVLIPDAMTEAGEQRGNFGFLMALLQVAEEAAVPKALVGVTDPLCPDPWAQDSHLFGYGTGPNGAQAHYVLRAFRNRKDKLSFKEEHKLTSGRTFKFRGSVPRQDCHQDYGGNFVVSPPITAETSESTGEPSVPAAAHVNAPYRKIIFGTNGHEGPSRTMYDFLEAHRLQPQLPLDLSALEVGHADEVLSFIPAPRGGNRRWKMLFASTPLAHRLLQSLHRKMGAQPIPHELWTDEGNYEIGVYSSNELLKALVWNPPRKDWGRNPRHTTTKNCFHLPTIRSGEFVVTSSLGCRRKRMT